MEFFLGRPYITLPRNMPQNCARQIFAASILCTPKRNALWFPYIAISRPYCQGLNVFSHGQFFIGLLAHDFLTLPILFLRANDKHINSTISTLSFQAFEIMECIGIFCWTQNRCPHVSLTLECIATSLAYRWGGVS